MSNFTFLKSEWPDVFESASKAESLVYPDPRAACFYARRALELAVKWAYRSDAELKPPYQDNLSSLIHEPSFKNAAGDSVFTKARLINKLGNGAVHSHANVSNQDSLLAIRELFHVHYWFARRYTRQSRPAPSIQFDAASLPKTTVPKQTIDQLTALENAVRERDTRLTDVFRTNQALSKEIEQLRAEIAAFQRKTKPEPDTHDYSESETRDRFIDVLLKEAGWALDQDRDREFEVDGMPNDKGKGWVDYVLWGDDGKPLGLVEAKRTRVSAERGREQARRYADCLERQFGQRPVIFYSNGHEHYIWDDKQYAPRAVQGFYTKSELLLMIQRRETRKRLAAAEVDAKIAGRYYQTRAIRRICESFERDKERKALVVMATGAGKTRTTIALCDLLMRCNWAKHILFLADRLALVRQAADNFKKHLPNTSVVNLVTGDGDAEGRICVATYPTMMGLIDERKDGALQFGPGHFDLIVVDEAHRSVYKKYKAIFEYFDSLLLGLTATPKEDVDKNTYSLFNLETGVPTDNYGLDDAVKDGYLVPARAISVPLKFHREGITYDQLTEAEKEEWDDVDWDESGAVPSRVEAAALNSWLFNQDTVDKVLEHLMTRGQKVAGGDRLGKTIIFAKNQKHAEFIAQRFDANYPNFKGAFARVVHCDLPYAQSLIEDFESADKSPHIAISVDMLDTGIDIHEIVNLVFFKMVRSKTKFWQMVGRGTRLREDLFGPGQDKEFFFIFDYCENLEFFRQNPQVSEGSSSASLKERLFKTRLELIAALDKREPASGTIDPNQVAEKVDQSYKQRSGAIIPSLRTETAALLHREVAAMNLDNFLVRPRRRLVEKFNRPEAWVKLNQEDLGELAREVSSLPSELEPEDQESKQFDLIILRIQLALLKRKSAFKALRDQVRTLAGLLEEKAAIPLVQRQLALILEIQTDEWWQDVTVEMLESARRRLRSLMKLIEKRERKPIYTNFEDTLGEEAEVELPQFVTATGFERFRAKARAFLQDHQEHIAIHKLRMNKVLTQTDLDELERILTESGLGQPEDLQAAKAECQGLGLFVRSLIGLERKAAKEAFSEFLSGTSFRANQIEFIDLIVNHLTEHGTMEAGRLYESPFTDICPTGPDGIFTSSQVDTMIAILETVRARARVG